MSLKKRIKRNIPQGFVPSLAYLGKWILLCGIVGLLAGSASAIFLISLEWATNLREAHLWIIALLPVGGTGDWFNISLPGAGCSKGQ